MAKPAARITDLNTCPITGHGTNPSTSGSPNVNINGLPVLRVGDTTACGDVVTEGISNILINGKPIAFLGSATAHGGMIITGSGDVFVGTETGSAPFTPIVTVPRHSEQFQLVDETSGQAIPDMLYCIETGDGQRLVGHTDGHGNAVRVFTDKPTSVVVKWGKQAAAHLDALGIDYSY
jgi:uncharacterized Zn-binding protein involved in type VI secretion